jgi:hypothetical protein
LCPRGNTEAAGDFAQPCALPYTHADHAVRI